MSSRRALALLLLLTIVGSSVEVLLVDASHGVSDAAAGEATGLAAAISWDALPSDDHPPADDCMCLCACGCASAQVVVVAGAASQPVTPWAFVRPVDRPAKLDIRPRPRPHIRPPLA